MYDQQTARKTLDFVEEWIPSEHYDHERKFQSELQDHLQQELNRDPLGGAKNHDVSTERGMSRGDVVVDDRVGIELKRDFSNDQERKLKGQLSDYRGEYDFVIACACGIDDMDGWNRVKKECQNTGMGIADPNTAPVEFVHKPVAEMGTDRSVIQRSGTERQPSTGDSTPTVTGSESIDTAELEQSIDEGIRGIRELTSDEDTGMSTGEAVIGVVKLVFVLAVLLFVVIFVIQTLIL